MIFDQAPAYPVDMFAVFGMYIRKGRNMAFF